MSGSKFLIVNADDFGYSHGINRGIREAHERGIVTSTSLIVNGPAVEEAAMMAADLPELSVGLHVNFTNEADRLVEFEDLEVCRRELGRQIDRFTRLLGRPPSHLDSHQHVHRHRGPRPIFLQAAAEHGIHLRDEPPVVYKGGFYGQWQYGVADPSKVSREALERILRNEIGAGIWELCCHPGYVDRRLTCIYHAERELELQTLTDPGLAAVLDELGIERISYLQLSRALGRPPGS